MIVLLDPDPAEGQPTTRPGLWGRRLIARGVLHLQHNGARGASSRFDKHRHVVLEERIRREDEQLPDRLIQRLDTERRMRTCCVLHALFLSSERNGESLCVIEQIVVNRSTTVDSVEANIRVRQS